MEKLLSFLLDIGEELLRAGAETQRVEDTLDRIAHHYHLGRVETFVTPTGLFVSLEGDPTLTGLRRVKNRGVDMGRLVAVNQLSRSTVHDEISIDEATTQLHALAIQPSLYPRYIHPLAGGLGSVAFTMLLGGQGWPLLVPWLIGTLIYFLREWTQGEFVYRFFHSFLGGFAAAFMAVLATGVWPHIVLSQTITGSILLLLPGLTLTNAIRDILTGDLLSGASRSLEASVIAIAIAAGVATGLILGHLAGGSIS